MRVPADLELLSAQLALRAGVGLVARFDDLDEEFRIRRQGLMQARHRGVVAERREARPFEPRHAVLADYVLVLFKEIEDVLEVMLLQATYSGIRIALNDCVQSVSTHGREMRLARLARPRIDRQQPERHRWSL